MDDSWTTIDSPNDLRLGELMPAWFAGRMLADEWKFGLLLSTGHTMLIRRIEAIYISPNGQILMDVDMLTDAAGLVVTGPVLLAPTERSRATINLSQVVAAFELADSSAAPED